MNALVFSLGLLGLAAALAQVVAPRRLDLGPLLAALAGALGALGLVTVLMAGSEAFARAAQSTEPWTVSVAPSLGAFGPAGAAVGFAAAVIVLSTLGAWRRWRVTR